MGDFFDWITLAGLGLIVGGALLLASAIGGVRRDARVSRRRHRAWRAVDRADRARREPQAANRRSAMLADTVLLKPVAPVRYPSVHMPVPDRAGIADPVQGRGNRNARRLPRPAGYEPTIHPQQPGRGGPGRVEPSRYNQGR